MLTRTIMASSLCKPRVRDRQAASTLLDNLRFSTPKREEAIQVSRQDLIEVLNTEFPRPATPGERVFFHVASQLLPLIAFLSFEAF